MNKKMLFVFNPKAGKGKIKTNLLDIVDIFNKGGYEVIIYSTQKPKDAYEKAKEYESKVDLIVCSGGDGTLDEVVTGVMEKKSSIPIGYIPAGSTNDFANSLFMPKSMTDAASMIMEEKLYHCDIGRFNNQSFTYIAAFGLFTDVAYQTDQDLKNILGHVAYLLEGVKRLFDIKSYHMRIESEELTVEDDFIFGMITNSRSVGTVYRIHPFDSKFHCPPAVKHRCSIIQLKNPFRRDCYICKIFKLWFIFQEIKISHTDTSRISCVFTHCFYNILFSL